MPYGNSLKQMFDELEKYVNSIIDDRKLTGCSIALVKEKQVAYKNGFGYANIERKLPIKPETIFRCASVTKPVITTGLLQLMEKGKFLLELVLYFSIKDHHFNLGHNIQGIP